MATDRQPKHILNRIQFRHHRMAETYSDGMYYPEGQDHNITAHDPNLENSDKPIAGMVWADHGPIQDIWVDKDYQRRGVATRMYSEGKTLARNLRIAEPEHSVHRTRSGDAWAKSTGDVVPALDDHYIDG